MSKPTNIRGKTGAVADNRRRRRASATLTDRRFTFALLPVLFVSACTEPTGGAAGSILWSVPADVVATVPLVVNQVVMFAERDGSVKALDLKDGSPIWTVELGAQTWGTEIGVSNGTIFVPHTAVRALNAATGNARWEYHGPGGTAGTSNVAVTENTVFTASAQGYVAALNAQTGVELWSDDLGEAAFHPTVAGDLVIYGTRGFLGGPRQGPLGAGRVVALDRTTGELVWARLMPDSIGFQASGGAVNGGLYADGLLIIGAMNSRVYGLEAATGADVWEHVSGEIPQTSAYQIRPVRLGSLAVLVRQDHVIEALDIYSGELRWRIERPVTVFPPTLDGALIFFTGGPLSAADQAGSTVWQFGGLGLNQGGFSYTAARASEESSTRKDLLVTIPGVFSLYVDRHADQSKQSGADHDTVMFFDAFLVFPPADA